MDTVRVLRIIEYIGPRDVIEKQIAKSLHGQRDCGNGVIIRATTLGNFPDIMEEDTYPIKEQYADIYGWGGQG